MQQHESSSRHRQMRSVAGRVFCLTVLFTARLSLSAPPGAGNAPKAKAMRIYMIGNSLTDNVKYDGFERLAKSRGHTHIWGRHMIPGAPIWWLWQHADSGFHQHPFGRYERALTQYRWDAITLQPFSMYSKEIEHAKKFIALAAKKSPDAQFFVYAQWMNRTCGDFDLYWLKTRLRRDHWGCGFKDHYETLVQELRQEMPEIKPPRLIPAGHAMYLLNQKIKAGQVPGYSSIFDVYNDGIHLNNVGAYIAGCSFFATIYGQTPIGLPVPEGYAREAGNMHHAALSPDLARTIQETVWETVTAHPLTGVTTDAPVKVASPMIAVATVGEPYTFDLLPAYGKAPYRWRLASGSLPPGLKLTDTGRIEGKPSARGDSRVTVEVSDAGGATATRKLVARVEADSTPSIAERSLPAGAVGRFYRHALRASGGNAPLYWRVKRGSKLPRGLELRLDGVLMGAPAAEFDGSFIAEAVDSDANAPEIAERAFNLRITPAGPEVLRVRKISRKAKVDGVHDESFWKPDRKIGKPAGGDFRGTAAFDVVWDGHTLYVAFRVQDNTISAKSEKPWENDSVELFLDYRNDRETVYNADDRRIVVDAAGRIEVVGLKRHIQQAARKTEGGYTVEIAVTGWNMGGYDSFKGKAVGFDVACNDSDASGKRAGRVVWRGTARNETDPSGFGTALLPEK